MALLRGGARGFSRRAVFGLSETTGQLAGRDVDRAARLLDVDGLASAGMAALQGGPYFAEVSMPFGAIATIPGMRHFAALRVSAIHRLMQRGLDSGRSQGTGPTETAHVDASAPGGQDGSGPEGDKR